MRNLKTILISGLVGALLSSVVWAAVQPTRPVGTSTLNQAIYGAPITPSNTVSFVQTRGIHIGDGSACNIAVDFVNGPGTSVSINNVQPGLSYPYSITRLYSSGTSCTSVVGLW